MVQDDAISDGRGRGVRRSLHYASAGLGHVRCHDWVTWVRDEFESATARNSGGPEILPMLCPSCRLD